MKRRGRGRFESPAESRYTPCALASPARAVVFVSQRIECASPAHVHLLLILSMRTAACSMSPAARRESCLIAAAIWREGRERNDEVNLPSSGPATEAAGHGPTNICRYM